MKNRTKLQKYKKLLVALLSHSDGFGAIALFVPHLQIDLGRLNRWGRFQRDLRQFDQMIFEEIKNHKTESGQDIMSMLISAQYEDGSKMQPQEIRDQLLTSLLAGHETTATALAWALYWLDKVPETYLKLMEELDSVEEWTPKVLSKLPYLDAVCKESLRLNPVIPIVARKLQKECEISGYHLRKGTLISPCIYLTHHREDLYPNSHEFQPQRFINRKYSPYEFLPFGGGVRRCIGAAFAMYEMKLVLATILKRFSFKNLNQELKMHRRSVAITPGKLNMVVLIDNETCTEVFVHMQSILKQYKSYSYILSSLFLRAKW